MMIKCSQQHVKKVSFRGVFLREKKSPLRAFIYKAFRASKKVVLENCLLIRFFNVHLIKDFWKIVRDLSQVFIRTLRWLLQLFQRYFGVIGGACA